MLNIKYIFSVFLFTLQNHREENNIFCINNPDWDFYEIFKMDTTKSFHNYTIISKSGNIENSRMYWWGENN